MPISNIASVTRTLITLIHEDLLSRHGIAVDVTAAAPDVAVSASTVSVHLLQLVETPEFRNLGLGSPRGPVPVQHTLMGVALQYVISVVQPSSTTDENEDALDRQRIVGHIARALHDYPIITPSTKIPAGGVQILNDELLSAGDTIQFILRPAPLQETISFWTTQDSKLARLCLFVEARVAVLEPLPPATVAGIVLSVGNFVFPSNVPQLSDSSNVLTFTPPTVPPASPSGPVSVSSSPARASLLPLAATDPTLLKNARLTLAGSGLFPGQRTLVLRQQGFKLAIDLERAAADNPNWLVDGRSGAVELTVRDSVVGVLNDDSAGASAHSLTPGTYGARLLIRRTPAAPPQGTNEVAFSVIPQTAGVSGANPGPYTLTILGSYLLDPTLDVELSVGGAVLALTSSAPSAGQFRIATGSTVLFVLPTGGPTPGTATPLAVRLVVNGAVATPEWITS